ncbi:MAG: Trk system potassium transporter TrkA [Clostridia bacterium]|nr:Trk system potassium transporter TrkA [Clostridia bacterium]
MKIIILGCGKAGHTVIASLTGEGHDIVAIDKSPDEVEDVTTTFDVMGLCGNGMDSDIMKEAGVSEAELFVAVTDSDEMNMLSCYIARKLGAKHTVARIRNPEYNDDSLVFLKHNLNISLALNPDMFVAHEISNILRFPSAVKVETFSGRKLEIVEIIMKEDSPFTGMKLSELRKKHNEKFLICYVMRDEEVYIPKGDFELKIGDRVGFTASHNEILKLLRNMGMPQKDPESVMIIGAGRSAYYLAKRLTAIGVTVKIVEKDYEHCVEISNLIPEAVVINGDGMQYDVLREEGINSTDAFITLTGTDEENILSALFAHEQGVPTVIAKVNRSELAQTAEKLGLECIVSPQNTVSDIISRYVRALKNSVGCNMETLYKLMDGKSEVSEFKVREDFVYVNIPISQLRLKANILVAGIVRGKKPIVPTGSDVILPEDRVIVISAGQRINDLVDIINC